MAKRKQQNIRDEHGQVQPKVPKASQTRGTSVMASTIRSMTRESRSLIKYH
jgi:hypothetical protein